MNERAGKAEEERASEKTLHVEDQVSACVHPSAPTLVCDCFVVNLTCFATGYLPGHLAHYRPEPKTGSHRLQ